MFLMEEAEYSQKYICVTCKSGHSYIGKVMAFCKETGESINAFMLRAVQETMARDKEKK